VNLSRAIAKATSKVVSDAFDVFRNEGPVTDRAAKLISLRTRYNTVVTGEIARLELSRVSAIEARWIAASEWQGIGKLFGFESMRAAISEYTAVSITIQFMRDADVAAARRRIGVRAGDLVRKQQASLRAYISLVQAEFARYGELTLYAVLVQSLTSLEKEARELRVGSKVEAALSKARVSAARESWDAYRKDWIESYGSHAAARRSVDEWARGRRAKLVAPVERIVAAARE
jgi:hypothetical protein